MWRRVNALVLPSVARHHSAFIFRSQALWSFETPRTTHPATKHHSPMNIILRTPIPTRFSNINCTKAWINKKFGSFTIYYISNTLTVKNWNSTNTDNSKSPSCTSNGKDSTFFKYIYEETLHFVTHIILHTYHPAVTMYSLHIQTVVSRILGCQWYISVDPWQHFLINKKGCSVVFLFSSPALCIIHALFTLSVNHQ
jgi:hypothetical protein